jgi:hypothetical protein
MEKISLVKYTDAYYIYGKECPPTKIPLHEAYGYVTKTYDVLLVEFIKLSQAENQKKENVNTVKGLIIPAQALISNSNHFVKNNLNDLTQQSKIAITWSDVVYIANVPRTDVSIMKSEGILEKNADDHIVLSHPKTFRIKPLPEERHPEKDPDYYVIPKSLILTVKTI